MPQGVHFTWKVSCFFQKVHTFWTMPPYQLMPQRCNRVPVLRCEHTRSCLHVTLITHVNLLPACYLCLHVYVVYLESHVCVHCARVLHVRDLDLRVNQQKTCVLGCALYFSLWVATVHASIKFKLSCMRASSLN